MIVNSTQERNNATNSRSDVRTQPCHFIPDLQWFLQLAVNNAGRAKTDSIYRWKFEATVALFLGWSNAEYRRVQAPHCLYLAYRVFVPEWQSLVAVSSYYYH